MLILIIVFSFFLCIFLSHLLHFSILQILFKKSTTIRLLICFFIEVQIKYFLALKSVYVFNSNRYSGRLSLCLIISGYYILILYFSIPTNKRLPTLQFVEWGDVYKNHERQWQKYPKRVTPQPYIHWSWSNNKSSYKYSRSNFYWNHPNRYSCDSSFRNT